MYEEGTVIYFTPFYFLNGGNPKSKYCIVLKLINGKSVLVSLTTTRDSVPLDREIKHGCIDAPEINFNCFVISPDIEITTNKKKMPLQSFIYGYRLEEYEILLLNDRYVHEGVDYEIFGKLKDDVFEAIINCLKDSKAVKNKYIRVLNS